MSFTFRGHAELPSATQLRSHAELDSASLRTSITISSSINFSETLKRPRKLSGQGDGVL